MTEGVVSLGNPALAVIRFDPAGGGVAYIARLLRAALTDHEGTPPPSIELDSRHDTSVTKLEALGFAARVARANLRSDVPWLLFGHPGIARAQGLIPQRWRKPFAVQLHGTDAWQGRLGDAVRLATLRIAPSRFTAARALAAHPDIGPIAVCPHGLLPESALESPGEVDAALLARIGPRSAVIVGRVWSLERGKGHDQLLECWSSVRAAIPDAQLVIAGAGDDLPRYRAKAEHLGIRDAVVLTGYVSRATRDALLERACVFAMPSQQEGFGIVYLEAMRLGVPCIGSTDDAADESIVHGKTGFLVPQSDRRALTQALVSVLGNTEIRRALGAEGRRRYLANFSFDRYKARVRELLLAHFGAWEGEMAPTPRSLARATVTTGEML